MSIDIVCTIGPASSKPDVLRELINHGMTIARINMSHGDHKTHQSVIRNVRDASKELGKKVRLLGDLQGPKIRLGEISNQEARLAKGNSFTLHMEPMIGNEREASVDYPGHAGDVKPNARILINDGEVELRVEKTTEKSIVTEVVVGGTIASHKGVNVPGTKVRLQAMTEKDKADIRFLLLEKADMIACSFIREASHLHEIRSFAGITQGHAPHLIAKMETLEGLLHLSQIMKAADGIMVARGDLGVEVPYTWVPLLQKAMIHECRRTNTYVITATQMLHSMVHHPLPTRAEVTDVFQAVLDGTDAVMLSAESAAGEFPVESVETLRTIATFAEKAAGEQPFDLKDIIELLSSDNTNGREIAMGGTRQ